MRRREPEGQVSGEPSEPDVPEPLFSAERRAELRRDLAPNAAARARVRHALMSSVATGALSPAAQRVDTLLSGSAATSGGAAATVHSLTAKLLLASVLVSAGVTAVVLRGPSDDDRPAVSGLDTPVESTARDAPDLPGTADVGSGDVTPDPAPAPTLLEVRELPSPSQEPTVAPAASPTRRSRATERKRNQPEPDLAARETSQPPMAASVVTSAPRSSAGEVPPDHAEVAARTVSTGPSQSAEAVQASSSTHALAAEIALVRAASAALQRHEPHAALTLLRRHGAEFPGGAMRVEVEALRAVALCSTQAEQAAAVSGQFLKAHAGSPLAERVRRACLAP